MKMKEFHLTIKQNVVLATLILIAVGLSIGVSELRRAMLVSTIKKTEAKYQNAQIEHDGRIQKLEEQLVLIVNENSSLKGVLESEKSKSDEFQNKIFDLSDTVSTLDKLSKTDPQLLQKYSKVYFLNEHYVPVELKPIAEEYRFDEKKDLKIHASVWPHLEDMIRDAEDDEMTLKVVSAFRSFGEQSALKASYKVNFGAGTANQFSADQGYSEHQLGTTMDIATPATGATLSGFDKTPEFVWMTEHAHEYGFTLSYPKNNSYYVYEPWHWRFVGVDLATKLHDNEMYFYDMDQREINSYLAKIFE